MPKLNLNQYPKAKPEDWNLDEDFDRAGILEHADGSMEYLHVPKTKPDEKKKAIWKPKKGGVFYMVALGAGAEIATMGLTGEQHNVLWFMMSQMRWDGLVSIKQADIAEALDMKITNVSRAIKKFKELDIIQEVEQKELRHKIYAFNMQLFVMGRNAIFMSNEGRSYHPPPPPTPHPATPKKTKKKNWPQKFFF